MLVGMGRGSRSAPGLEKPVYGPASVTHSGVGIHFLYSDKMRCTENHQIYILISTDF